GGGCPGPAGGCPDPRPRAGRRRAARATRPRWRAAWRAAPAGSWRRLLEVRPEQEEHFVFGGDAAGQGTPVAQAVARAVIRIAAAVALLRCAAATGLADLAGVAGVRARAGRRAERRRRRGRLPFHRRRVG